MRDLPFVLFKSNCFSPRVQEVVVPILAQRLLINMRSVDYMGSRPLASTLMFAPSTGESEGSSESYDMAESTQRPPPSDGVMAEGTTEEKDPTTNA